MTIDELIAKQCATLHRTKHSCFGVDLNYNYKMQYNMDTPWPIASGKIISIS